MLHLYTWHTPNGKKPLVLLAELGVPFEAHLVDLSGGDQKSPEYLAINPNGKIPALIDEDGDERIVVFESGAVLEYLADKFGRFLPRNGAARYETLSWVYWQVGGPGPFFGQAGKWSRTSPRNHEARSAFVEEAMRLAGVLEERMRGREWIARDYSIADIACYPWFEAIGQMVPEVLDGAHAVREWMARVAARPAVRRGMDSMRLERQDDEDRVSIDRVSRPSGEHSRHA